MSTPLPLVSCLCLTRNRPLLLKRAITCFLAQTYKPAELLVVVREDDPESKTVAESFGRDNIRIVEVPAKPEKSIGELRNLAIRLSRGEYFCQWDDDDWYHNARIETQINSLLFHEKSASALVKYIIFDVPNRQAYLSPIGPWSSSMMCRKDLVTEEIRYPHVSLHEDTVFLNRLFTLNCLFPVIAPWTYIYVFHGKNTWNSRHFRQLFAKSKKLSPALSELVGDVLDEKLDNATASKLLMQPDVIREMDYFYFGYDSNGDLFTTIGKISMILIGRFFAFFVRRRRLSTNQ